jgi:hypothetical protein
MPKLQGASMKSKVWLTCALTLISLTSAAQMKATVNNGNWGGYWWSMLRGETVMGWSDGAGRKEWSEMDVKRFSKCLENWVKTCEPFAQNKAQSLSPLMKFDLYVKKLLDRAYEVVPVTQLAKTSDNELKIHYIGDNTGHPHWDSQGYAGKCIGWALASIDYSEPNQDKELEGILFKPADIKAILSTLYNGGQFFVPDQYVVGEAFRDAYGTDKEFEDVLPREFILALQETIGVRKKALVADLDPYDGVWNHPVFGYEIKIVKQTATQIDGSLTIQYANDQVGIDEVFSTSTKREDHLTRKLKFKATIPAKWNGDFKKVTKSSWVGESVDLHPDSLVLGLEKNWRKEILKYKNTDMKKEVNFQLLKNINLGNGWESAVDHLLKRYYK